MGNKKLLWLAMAGLLTSVQGTVHASDSELLEVLQKNRVISDNQYKELKKTYGKKESSGAKVSTKGGVKVKSDDGNFSFKLGGRVQFDAAYSDDDVTELDDGLEFRRLRIAAKGTVYKDFAYKIQVDYSDDNLDVKDAYFKYKPWGLLVGSFKGPFGLEELTSSNDITFMERSSSGNAFNTSHRRGIGIQQGGSNYSVAAMLYGQNDSTDDDDQEDYGAGVRLTYAPLASKGKVVHLGFGLASEKPTNDSDTLRLRSRAAVHHPGNRLVDTRSNITAVDNIMKYGLEAAFVTGPFSMQAEYFNYDVERDNGQSDLEFDGYYVQAAYALTGESRKYKAKKGAFGGYSPKGKWGAWEVALRYDTVDLTDDNVVGGEQDVTTLGLNWYLNKQVRVMLNYADVDVDDARGNVGQDEDVEQIGLRTQIKF